MFLGKYENLYLKKGFHTLFLFAHRAAAFRRFRELAIMSLTRTGAADRE